MGSDKGSGRSEGDITKNPVVDPSLTPKCKPKPNGLRGSNGSTLDTPGNESGRGEQVPSDSNPDELSEYGVISMLEQILNQHSNEEWVVTQDADPVIRRMKELLVVHDE